MTQTPKTRLWRLLSVAIALALWEMIALWVATPVLLATPWTVIVRLWELMGTGGFWQSVGNSTVHIMGGFFFGLVLGGALGVVAHRLPFVDILLWPVVTGMKSVPVVCFIMLCFIWMDVQYLSIMTTFLMVFPVIYTNTLQGMKQTDKKLLEMAQVHKLSWPRKIRYIYLAQMRPYFLAGTSVALGLSWKAGVAAEVIGVMDNSIGEGLYEAKIYFEMADLMAWTVVIVVASMIFEKGISYLLGKGFQTMEVI